MKLFPIPSLEAGETIRESWFANRTQSFRTVGGRLYLTDRRVVFEPHLLDANLGGKRCSLELRDITGVGLQPAEFKITNLFNGALRTRLRVETKLGMPECFVVQSPKEKQQVLAAALGSPKKKVIA